MKVKLKRARIEMKGSALNVVVLMRALSYFVVVVDGLCCEM